MDVPIPEVNYLPRLVQGEVLSELLFLPYWTACPPVLFQEIFSKNARRIVPCEVVSERTICAHSQKRPKSFASRARFRRGQKSLTV
jgi:hypothetical protein